MEIQTSTAILVPIVVALVQLLKGIGLPVRFAPLASLVLGVLGTLVVGTFDVLAGVVVGLSAAGLYSGARTTLK